ncbi:MAG TPA: hypothetical protein VGC45_15625 [Gryllotalpicola sp.]
MPDPTPARETAITEVVLATQALDHHLEQLQHNHGLAVTMHRVPGARLQIIFDITQEQ